MKAIKVVGLCFVVGILSDAAITNARTVRVDCDRGKSINNALDNQADVLIVEIEGECTEDVEIRRDFVTLRSKNANDPASITGATTVNEPGLAVVRVRNARNVRIENLRVINGVRNGIAGTDAWSLVIDNCQLAGNANFGVTSTSGTVTVQNTTIVGGRGVAGFEGGFLSCVNCTIEADTLGIYSIGGSRVSASNSNITAFYAVGATQAGSDTTIFNSTITGSLDAEFNSIIVLNSVTQTDNFDQNYAITDSTIRAGGTTSLVGSTLITEFSKFLMLEDTTHNGDVTCALGSDAVCTNPGNITGPVSGCNLCTTSLAAKGSPNHEAAKVSSKRPEMAELQP